MEEEIIYKTGFEWGVFLNESIFDLINWKEESEFYKDEYNRNKYTLDEYRERTSDCKMIRNKRPIREAKYLEYIMYGFVPYQLAGIHKGIQYGHAKDILSREVKGEELKKYNLWLYNDLTYIIKSGGTTNEDPKYLGGMQKCRLTLKNNGIAFGEFRERDANTTLTGLAFLVDERVWNTTLYPDFVPAPVVKVEGVPYKKMTLEEIQATPEYISWLKLIGGETNAFLRTWLRKFPLA